MKLFLDNFYELTKLYWKNKDSRKDWIRLILIVLLTIFDVYLSTQFNEWKNAFYTALQNYNYDQVIVELIWFCKLAAVNILVTMYIFYLQQVVVMNWRQYLSEHFIDRWLENNNFYRANLVADTQDNPDQRVGEDIRLFIEKTIKFTLGVLNAGLSFVLFVNILWKLSGVIPITLGSYTFNLHGYIVWISLLYSFVGTFITHKIGKRLNMLNYWQQKLEADFRYAMVRLREYSENIAIYSGIDVERSVLLTRLYKLLNNFKEIILKERQIAAMKQGYFQSASIIPVLIGVPLYMKRTINLGGLMQSASAFSRVTGSLSYFVMLYMEFAEWQSVVGRLTDFRQHLQKLDEENKQHLCIVNENENFIRAKDLAIYKPSGEVLLNFADFELKAGEATLLTGENGLGKSTLFRTLAGIWPFYSGVIFSPTREQMMFVSQRPYLPLGTLRQGIMYPKQLNAGEQTEALEYWLGKVGLTYLVDKLDKEADWGNILSLGEMQKIAIIRVLMNKPQWVFLDEATSSMDKESEAKSYSLLLEQSNMTIISIGHGKEIEKYHQRVINL